MSVCGVQQIQVLDKDGFWMRRNIYLNMDETFIKGLKKVVNDRSVPNSYTTVRKIQYD